MSQSPLHGTGSLHTRAGAFDATRRQAITKPTGMKAGWNPNKFDQSKRQALKALKNQKWHRTTDAAVTEGREAIIEAIIAEMVKDKKKVTVVKRIGKRLYMTVSGKKRKKVKEAIIEDVKRRGLDWRSPVVTHHGTTQAMKSIQKVNKGTAYGMAVGRAKERAAGDLKTFVKAAKEQRFSRYPKRRVKVEAIIEALNKKQSGHHGLLGFEVKSPAGRTTEPPDMEPTDGGFGPAGRVAHAG